MTNVPVTKLLRSSVIPLTRLWICCAVGSISEVCCCCLFSILFLRHSNVRTCCLMFQMRSARPSHHTCGQQQANTCLKLSFFHGTNFLYLKPVKFGVVQLVTVSSQLLTLLPADQLLVQHHPLDTFDVVEQFGHHTQQMRLMLVELCVLRNKYLKW